MARIPARVSTTVLLKRSKLKKIFHRSRKKVMGKGSRFANLPVRKRREILVNKIARLSGQAAAGKVLDQMRIFDEDKRAEVHRFNQMIGKYVEGKSRRDIPAEAGEIIENEGIKIFGSLSGFGDFVIRLEAIMKHKKNAVSPKRYAK
jgi:hypothetical protein